MIALSQNSPEWLEFRKTKIGASDAPIIMEVSPWKTPYQLWEEKIGLKENVVNYAMRGTLMEDEARQSFEQQIGMSMFPMVKVHPEKDWAIASLDGIDIEEKLIVEIKCPGKEDHMTAMKGEVPEKYYPQLQHQLFVTGLDMVYYFSYTPTSSKILEVKREDYYIREMVAKSKKFHDCVMNFTPPELTERDYVERSDKEWEALSSSYLNVQEKIKALEEEEKSIRENLISIASSSNSIGYGIKLSKIIRKGSVDYQSIPELKDVNLEKYRKTPIQSWRIAVA